METTTSVGDGEATTVVQQQQLVQEQEQKTIIKVMVAIDESEESFYALQWALQNLFHHQNHRTTTTGDQEPATIIVVHVQVPFQPAYISGVPAGPIIYATTTITQSMKKAQEESAAKIFSCASELCRRHKMKAKTILIEGDPKEMICQAVEKMNADLLVVGSRGLGQIKRALLGSVSDYCAHHAKCAVLIVRPPPNASRK